MANYHQAHLLVPSFSNQPFSKLTNTICPPPSHSLCWSMHIFSTREWTSDYENTVLKTTQWERPTQVQSTTRRPNHFLYVLHMYVCIHAATTDQRVQRKNGNTPAAPEGTTEVHDGRALSVLAQFQGEQGRLPSLPSPPEPVQCLC